MKKLIELIYEFLSGIGNLEHFMQDYKTLARFADSGKIEELVVFDCNITDIEQGFSSYLKTEKKQDARVFEINRCQDEYKTNVWFFDNSGLLYELNLTEERLELLKQIIKEFDKYNEEFDDE